EGVAEHLDGMFAIAPQWIKGIVSAAAVNDWPLAAAYQAKLNELRAELINSASVMGAFTVMMNARGIPGRFHGAPYASLDERQRDALCASAVMRSLTSEASAA
ncbi:MAG: hypothetical protein IT424_01975, partial [Pirellulales bacterium]|nr:hypothetical protein [Pirellulales bacterium]